MAVGHAAVGPKANGDNDYTTEAEAETETGKPPVPPNSQAFPFCSPPHVCLRVTPPCHGAASVCHWADCVHQWD